MNAAVRSAAISAILLADFGFSAGRSADLTAREVTTRLYEAGAGTAIDLSSRDLRFLDLSGLDFKAARLSGSDLYGTDFTDARLAGSDLTHTRLDRSVLIRADFSGANLAGSTILRPTVFSTPSFNLADAPKFAGANLRGVRFMAHFEGAACPRGRSQRRRSQSVRATRGTEGSIDRAWQRHEKLRFFRSAVAWGRSH